MSLETVLRDAKLARYADIGDYNECRRLHRKFGTTYYLASRFFPEEVRMRIHALYGFVRLPDEWVDNPDAPLSEISSRLQAYREELIDGVQGVRPECGVLRAFCDVVSGSKIPLEEPLGFLTSMAQDLDTKRYETYEQLRGYMRGSAGSVGVMMCYALADPVNHAALPFAIALGEAMQMTNFIRDVGEDAERRRIYLPREHLEEFRVSERQILERKATSEFKELIKYEIGRTHKLYEYANQGIELLPDYAYNAVRLASVLYHRILFRIEAMDYDVFRVRARTSKSEKLICAARVLMGLRV